MWNKIRNNFKSIFQQKLLSSDNIFVMADNTAIAFLYVCKGVEITEILSRTFLAEISWKQRIS